LKSKKFLIDNAPQNDASDHHFRDALERRLSHFIVQKTLFNTIIGLQGSINI